MKTVVKDEKTEEVKKDDEIIEEAPHENLEYYHYAKKPASMTKWKTRKGPKHRFAETDGKTFICNFDKYIRPEFGVYDKFMIKKVSYENQLSNIVDYVNYFVENYDLENELMMAYLKVAYTLENRVKKVPKSAEPQRAFDNTTDDAFRTFLYEIMFTKTVVNKINQMVEDNYTDDIETQPNDVKKKYQKNEKKHLESLEFTNKHIKILLRISTAIKFMAGPIFQYLFIRGIKIEKDSDVLFNFYKPLFDIFGEGVNIYNKLFVYVKTKVGESNSNNNPIFDQREIFGTDLYSVIDAFTKKVLISENIVKYKFNENIIGFNKVVIQFQLNYFLKDSYAKNLTEVTNTKNSEGLSGVDKMMMNQTKIDEGTIIIADLNISTTLDRIKRNYDIEITDEEVQYFIEHTDFNEIQRNLVKVYWANQFGSYTLLDLLTRKQYAQLTLLLKRLLMAVYACGSKNSDNDSAYRCILPYVLTANVEGRINTRTIKNDKFRKKVTTNYMYKKLCDRKFSAIESIYRDYLISYLSKFINTSFTYVSYEHPEMTGKTIEYSEDQVTDELLFFLDQT